MYIMVGVGGWPGSPQTTFARSVPIPASFLFSSANGRHWQETGRMEEGRRYLFISAVAAVGKGALIPGVLDSSYSIFGSSVLMGSGPAATLPGLGCSGS